MQERASLVKKSRPVLESAAWTGMSLDRGGAQTLHVQLYEMVKRKIENGALVPGSRLPSSRSFASELGVARTTVTAAYEQLIAEGYVTSRPGARPEVTSLNAANFAAALSPPRSAEPAAPPTTPSLLAPGVPDLRLFPYRAWMNATMRSWRTHGLQVLESQEPAGTPRLRRALARHLAEWRGITADPEQILITAGSAGALQLLLDSLTRHGDTVATEEPGYAALPRLASRRGVRIVPVPVDEQGVDVAALRSSGSHPRFCVVTPSHQFPLGGAMSIGRRLELLDWAREADALIVEDDYDSEFRYDGHPVPALYAVAHEPRVIYVGTTSKVFSPSMRIGYIVAPAHLARRLTDSAADLEQRASIVPQFPLAEMIESGEYARHLRRMRRVYRERGRLLTTLLRTLLPPPILSVGNQAAGLHLLARFGPALAGTVDDEAVRRRCAERGVAVRALSSFYQSVPAKHGLLLGFAAFAEDELRRGVERLVSAIGEERLGASEADRSAIV